MTDPSHLVSAEHHGPLPLVLGITGHRDHIAIGSMARQSAKKSGIPYFAFALPPRAAKNAPRWLQHRRRSDCYHHHIVYKKPALRIRVDARHKMRALRFHVSQLEKGSPFTGIPPAVQKEFLSAEYFTFLVW